MQQDDPSIIYEDDVLLVINKPAGMTVNRSETTQREITVQDWVEKYRNISFPEKTPVHEEDNETIYMSRSGIVHRIDKETSGVLLIAKSVDAFISLQSQFKTRIVKKTYMALAHGKVVPISGEINVPVGRLPWNRRQFGVVAGGRESKTLYTVKQYYRFGGKTKETLSLLEVNPVTGRTHQIRVHLQYLGHPIFADFLYAGRKTQREDRKVLSRVFLHALRVTFHHPISANEQTVTAPLPEELQRVIDTLEPTDENTV